MCAVWVLLTQQVNLASCALRLSWVSGSWDLCAGHGGVQASFVGMRGAQDSVHACLGQSPELTVGVWGHLFALLATWSLLLLCVGVVQTPAAEVEICFYPSESPAPAEVWERENWTSQVEQECSCSSPSCIFEPGRNLALQRTWWIQNVVELFLQSYRALNHGQKERLRSKTSQMHFFLPFLSYLCRGCGENEQEDGRSEGG